jgi:ATP-binding cassette, subfamily B, bacterial IrtA/YbtP
MAGTNEGRRPSQLGGLLAPVKSRLVAAVVLQALATIAGLVPFVAVAEIGRELLSADVDDGRVWRIAFVAAGALLVRVALLAAAAGITHFADNDLQLDIRRRFADRLGRVPLGWFGDRSAGEVKKAVVDDVAAMHHLVGHSLTDMTAAVVAPVVTILSLTTVDWRLTIVTLVPVVVGLVLYSRQMSGYGEKMEQYNAALGDVNTGAVEFVQGSAVVKAFGQTGRAHQRFLDAAHRFVDMFWAWVSGLIKVSAASDVVLAPLASLLTIAAGGTWFVAQGWADAVDLLPFFLLGLAITAPILTLGFTVQDLQVASQAADRVATLLATPALQETAAPREPADAVVRYERVRFSYDGARDVLDEIDLVLPPGTVTALVGPSGGGKSTIATLLCRFRDPTAGAITLGGVDLRDIATHELTTEDLMAQLAMVFQDTYLFAGTIRENLLMARSDATDADLARVASLSRVDEILERLPDGWNSQVGEGGAALSGGERQRVAIARALLKQAPIVLLDDSTASLDPANEMAVQNAIDALRGVCTVIVIAHRLQTVTTADQIVVLDGHGGIAERGTHTELVGLDGRYADFWRERQRARGWRLAPA